ncbi:MAG TPA: mandelate racemase/muconate lactonizing enzyme family protein [Planctomycetota bacterium]|nr:mandelate racemase/muconate lactonizing enzyme family protein [Planctomycetota bacterium]
MKIAKVESFLLSCPLPQPLKLTFWNGERTILKRDAMILRVTSDTGLRGYAPGPAHERAAHEIRDVVAPYLVGKDPLRWSEFKFQGDLETTKTYHAVEIAVLDLAARHAGKPLSELAGGRVRDTIKLYGSGGMYQPPEHYAAEAKAVQDMGFPAYKYRPALGPAEDLRTVKLMREATGPNFGIMIDAHSWWRMGDKSYSFDQVASLAKDIAKYGPVWLEEPLPPDDHAAYRKLKALNLLPLATGEHEQEEAGFLDLIRTRAANYIQMDVCCQGGFAMGRRVCDALAKEGLKFAFHCWGTTLEVLAAAHFGVCFPESVVEWLEYPCHGNFGRKGMYPFPLADEILTQPLAIHHGILTVPTGPGLGVEVDERVIEKYPWIPGPWSYFKIHSPPETIAVTGDHSVKWVEAK